MSDVLKQAHALSRTLNEVAWFPPHPPRHASAEYARVHRLLVVERDEPCWICGLHHSDVAKLPRETRKWWQIETHHAQLEWAQEPGVECNPAALRKFYDELHGLLRAATAEALREFLDSEGNLLVLCAAHHRGSGTGIHAVSYPAWHAQRLQFGTGPDAFQFIRQQLPSSPQS